MNIPEHKITSRPYPKDPSLTQVFYRFKEPLFVYGKSKGLSLQILTDHEGRWLRAGFTGWPMENLDSTQERDLQKVIELVMPKPYVPKPPRIYTTTFTVTTPDRLEPDDEHQNTGLALP